MWDIWYERMRTVCETEGMQLSVSDAYCPAMLTSLRLLGVSRMAITSHSQFIS